MGLVDLSTLAIDDEDDYRHIALYGDLKRVALASGKRALVLPPSSVASWDRASFLNLCFWDEGTADVLTEPALDADVLMHVAWHHLAHTHLRGSPEASLLGEAIASAFDIYLVGRLLGHRPEAAFLEGQVPRMTEAALAAGCTEDDVEGWLAFASASPEAAFEELRQLLFDASVALSRPLDPRTAAAVLERFDGHRFAGLLHHYELSTWVLRARIDRLERAAQPAGPERTDGATVDAASFDAELRACEDSIALLERRWIRPALGQS
jgi:hypothetical protein